MRIEIFKIFTQFLNYTITAVILSHPTPSKNEKIIQEVSWARFSSKNWHPVSSRDNPFSNLYSIKSQICSLDNFSQIPSHPIIKNLSEGLKLYFYLARYIYIYKINWLITRFCISGAAVIIYYSGFKLLSCLYSRSPNARDKFKFPLILPSITMN
jgi:hypothetical protein